MREAGTGLLREAAGTGLLREVGTGLLPRVGTGLLLTDPGLPVDDRGGVLLYFLDLDGDGVCINVLRVPW